MEPEDGADMEGDFYQGLERSFGRNGKEVS